jgi:hypothetical protein
MEIEPGCVNTAVSRSDNKIPSVSDDPEGVLEVCYELVCLGRPLPEILEEVKRLADVSKRRTLEIPAELADAQVYLGTGPAKIESHFRKTTTIASPPEASTVEPSRSSQDARDTFTRHEPIADGRIVQQTSHPAAHAGPRLDIRSAQSLSPFFLVTGICALAVVAETTSPVLTQSNSNGSPVIEMTFETAALRPNSAKPAEAFALRLAWTYETTPTPTNGGGIFRKRDLAFGAGGSGAPERNPAFPEVIRPNLRVTGPATARQR